MGSKKFTIDMTDFWSLVRGGLLVGSAAALTYIGQNLGGLDLGDLGTLIVPVVTVGINTVIKWLKSNQEVKE